MDQAKSAMKRAADYYHGQIAVNGGYVYYYAPDLSRRMGEGVATKTQVWVQPPGTPTVGLAYLEAWRATDDPFYLTAATDAARALIYGQLKSGAWTNSVDFDPNGRTALYRNGKGRGRNFSTLDDGISQSAIRLLMHVDNAREFNNREVHEAVQTALDALLEAQFNNGAFPQGWDDTRASDQPVMNAGYPDYNWRTEGRVKEYWDRYTLNDGLAGTVTQTLQDAYEIYGSERYMTALTKLGDFLLLAQMPQPQPAWAQQYNYAMQPIWARRFEPPAIAGRESQDVLKALLQIYRVTGDDKYLKPVPPALKYLRNSMLSDGRLARYYELQTNRPLYMSRRGKQYFLTHDDANLPSHYGWKVASELDEIEQDYQLLRRGRAAESTAVASEAQVRGIIQSLDGQNRWVSTFAGEPLTGQPKFREADPYISSDVFSQNLTTLSRFVAAD